MSEPRAARPRVAMIGYTFYDSDARLIRHTSHLVEAGYDVDVLVLRPAGDDVYTEAGPVRFYRLQERRYDRQGGGQFIVDYSKFALRVGWHMLKQLLSGRRYRFAHVNNMPNFLLLAVLPFRLVGTRNLLDVHDTMPELYMERAGVDSRHWMVRALRMEERICLLLAGFVLTTEHTKRDRLMENGLRESKSFVLMNLADPKVFPEFPIEEGTHEGADSFRLVYHGTLTRRLGVDIAIRAVAEILDRVPGLRFDIIGDGEQREALVDLTKELGVEDVVRFSDGFVPTEKLPELLRGADLAVLASRRNAATDLMLPVKLLEYVRTGIPAVVVGTKTIRYYFSEDQVRTVEEEDIGGLGAAIVDLYAHPEARVALAKQARSFYEDYDISHQYARYLEIVEGR